jgi:ribosomal protein S18 acetylase RimI-like enzyme
MPASALSSQPLSIRRATAADIPLLRGLAERTWRQCYAAILSPEQMDYMLGRMYAPEVIAREIADGVVWELAAESLTPVGFHACAFDPADRTLKLHKLYVLPEAQGRGFGKALLERVRALAGTLGARKAWLQVNKNNAAAIRAYERAGYCVERAAVFDIGGGFVMDDFIMALAIPAPAPLSTKDAAPVGT